MSAIADGFMLKMDTCFGGGNTEDGFVNYFPEITKGTDRLYILKGGCGCGKNSLMRKVAAAAEKKGLLVERIYCASDPDSLDGVLIPERNTGVLDGTPPHERSPRLVGAMDRLVDLGEYLRGADLRERVARIKTLSEEKAAAYRRAYGLLGAMGALLRERQGLIREGLLTHKLEAAAGRYADKLKGDGVFEARLCPRFALCSKGEVKLGTDAECWCVEDSYGIGYLFLSAMAGALKERGVPFAYSPAATSKARIAALYLKGGRLLIGGGGVSPKRLINMERFVDRSALAAHRGQRRFLTKTAEAVKENAVRALAEAREKHCLLEEIYTPCMDFGRVEQRTAQLISETLA